MAAKCILFSSIACFTSEKLFNLKSVWILARSSNERNWWPWKQRVSVCIFCQYPRKVGMEKESFLASPPLLLPLLFVIPLLIQSDGERVHLFGRQIHGVTDQSSQLLITVMPLHLYPNLKADTILQNFKSLSAVAALKFQNLQIWQFFVETFGEFYTIFLPFF